MRFINHNQACKLEYIVRGTYDCNRFGVMGVANADHLESCPMDAILVVFAPLYKNNKEIPEIDQFVDECMCLFNYPDEYEYDEIQIENIISKFDCLVDKYIKNQKCDTVM